MDRKILYVCLLCSQADRNKACTDTFFSQPRKGCFEVRNTESGEKYVSLLVSPSFGL